MICFTGISCNLVSSKSIKSETCSQVGKPERNVTLMYGMHHENVQHKLIGHVHTLKECVELACRRANTSLAYTSRFDCYSVVCKGNEELCWFLPSFHNPTLVFARLERKGKVNDASQVETGGCWIPAHCRQPNYEFIAGPPVTCRTNHLSK